MLKFNFKKSAPSECHQYLQEQFLFIEQFISIRARFNVLNTPEEKIRLSSNEKEHLAALQPLIQTLELVINQANEIKTNNQIKINRELNGRENASFKYFLDLPPEMIQEILSHLSFYELALMLSTSKSMIKSILQGTKIAPQVYYPKLGLILNIDKDNVPMAYEDILNFRQTLSETDVIKSLQVIPGNAKYTLMDTCYPSQITPLNLIGPSLSLFSLITGALGIVFFGFVFWKIIPNNNSTLLLASLSLAASATSMGGVFAFLFVMKNSQKKNVSNQEKNVHSFFSNRIEKIAIDEDPSLINSNPL